MFAHVSSAVFIFSFLRNEWKLLIETLWDACFAQSTVAKPQNTQIEVLWIRTAAPENDWSVRVTPLFIFFSHGWLIIAPLGFGLLFGPKDESLYQEIKDSLTDNESNLYNTWV